MEQFVIRAPQAILTRWGHAPTPLPPTMQEKLSRCGDDAVYVRDVLPRLLGVSISAEVSFFADVGQELYMEFPALAEEYLAIADDGQGDLWLMHLRRGTMYFFDHGAWETPLTELAIDFWGFLQLADLMAQWEDFLDGEPSDTSQAEEHLRGAMRELAPGLPETYPFALR